jgi:hypothetical protein
LRHIAHATWKAGAADPSKLARVGLEVLAAKRRLNRDVAGNRTDNCAVARGDVIEIVGRQDSRCALHVLDNDGWVARDMAAEMAS